ncbi:MAG: helix-turn-helix domain-containing protein [Acidobacteria bacterium]|nr:helix-turn-helix domain-containing protein [Acidobacteriota bacterium]
MTDFGVKLRQAREGRGISVRQIAASTKIAVAALEALERNDISKLPGGIFSRSFVRSYAAEVGLDPDQTVREFLERFEAEPPPPPVAPMQLSDEEHAFESRRQGAMLTVKVLVVALLAAGVLLFFVVLRGRKNEPASGAAAAPKTDVTQAPAAPSGPPPESRGQTPIPDAAPPVAALPTGAMRVDLHPTGPCWINVVVDGQNVFSGIMQGGERRTLTVREAAVIDVGDAGAFAFSVDGRRARPLGMAGQVKTARLTRQTVSQYVR